MHRGILAYVVILIVLIIGAYVYTGFKLLPLATQKSTSTAYTSTTLTTTTPTTSATTTINYNNFLSSCYGLKLVGTAPDTTNITECSSNGGEYGLWVAAGNYGSESVQIIGANNRTYVNQTSNYDCITFYQNFTLTPQAYRVIYQTGHGGSTCGKSTIVINGSTAPPIIAYQFVYNGNFDNGEYTGWNVSSPGFGTAPLNITYANKKLCYQGRPWSNYNGTYFATTYNCGITTAPGNITSSPFIVNPSKPFLNFKLISPQDNNLYVELLRANYRIVNGQQVYTNSSPVEIVHFNTFNLSITSYSQSTFTNVTLPLTLYINEPLQVRIVSRETGQNFIAAGDFAFSNRPHQDAWVTENLTFTG